MNKGKVNSSHVICFKLSKIITLIILAFALITIIGCDGNGGGSGNTTGGGGNPTLSDFYGIWKNSSNITFEISRDKITYKDNVLNKSFDVDSYNTTLKENHENSGIDKDKYPSGFLFEGTVSNLTGAPVSLSGSPESLLIYANGDTFSLTFYIDNTMKIIINSATGACNKQ